MGVVWRARDQLLDRDVAVKEVQIAETLTDVERANAYQRTLREAKTAARLNHPGVVTVYDVAEDGGRPWIVMQLVHAQSLDQVLVASGPLSPRRAAEVGRQLLSALSVAHAAGVMHRDVKPSNVLLGRDDRAVLTDFGIATFQGDPRLTQTGMVMGSPGFTAPERIRGEDASPASDLWSLGATLFAAVEGHGPYEKRGGAITTMSAIINEDAPSAPTAGALGPVIAALLRREPSDRPDASTATRMITDVLPLLPARTGAQPAGYVATALAASPSPSPSPSPSRSASPSPGWAVPGEPAGLLAAADTQGGDPGLAGTAATTPQPVLGDAARFDPPVTEFDQPKSAYDVPPTEYRPPTEYDRPRGDWGSASVAGPAAGPSAGSAAPPDFSSWYDPAPRSGPAPSAQPWAGAAYQAGSGYQQGSAPAAGPGAAQWAGSAPPAGGRTAPAGPRKRRTGLWLALVLLAVLGAGAGAATIVLLRHGTTGTPLGGSSSPATSSSSGTGTLAPPETAPQIVNAINEHTTGPLPAEWTTVTRPATGTEKAGFTIAAPSNWTSAASGYQNYLYDPSANANILIDLTPHTYPNDMLKEAQYIKRQSLAQNRFPGYLDMGLQAGTIRGTPGAWWKFTWVDKGVNQEAIDLLFVLHTPAGAQSYALYMTAPQSMWNQMRPIFDEMVETFAPLT
jgi:eukaryotic-like serine/threonine-protein kinase